MAHTLNRSAPFLTVPHCFPPFPSSRAARLEASLSPNPVFPMKRNFLCSLPLLFLPLGCSSVDHSTHHHANDAMHHADTHDMHHGDDPFAHRKAVDAAQRDQLWAPIQALEGNWAAESGETVFEITAAGSVVRETMMPGQAMEMVNMYSMDGNHLRMTHYCGGGNQPHMVASQWNGQELVFEADGVSDLKEADQGYMGSMTLRMVDEDTMEQHWYLHSPDGVSDPMVFRYTRVD